MCLLELGWLTMNRPCHVRPGCLGWRVEGTDGARRLETPDGWRLICSILKFRVAVTADASA